MIRINLLKSPTPQRRTGPTIGARALAFSGVILGAGVCIAGIALLAPRLMPARIPAKKAEQAPDRAPPPPMVNARVVEEVVRDITMERDKLQQSGELRLLYEQLSMPEKINFEWLFAKQACDLLIRVIPERVGLRLVEIENFATIYGVGLSSSRSDVTALFTALKGEKVNVLPMPISFIKDNEAGGFRFGFGCEAQWGLQLADPFVDLSLSRLPSRNALESTIETFVRLAKEAGVAARSSPTRIEGMKAGAWRRFTYRWAAASTFVVFADFLKRLYDVRMPCAFQSLKLSAEPGGKIRIDAVVIFTTKE